MSEIQSGYTPYKKYRYNASTDKYELISHWTSASTVHRTGGSTLDNELNSIERKINNLIDDDDVDDDSTWSSEKIKGNFDALPVINDTATTSENLWSATKVSQHILQSYMIPAGGTVTLPRFEGYFALVHRNSFTHGALGILDRWGGVTWIDEGICAPTEETGTPIVDMRVSGDTVIITNSSTVYVAAYYFRTTYGF